MSKKSFAVVGAGGVGGYFAAVLARAGYSVSVIARGAQLEAIRQGGLRVGSAKGDFTVAVAKASDNPEDVGQVDAVILAVKAWQVTEAATTMRPLLGPLTKVLPLQNGVEATGQLQQVLGSQHSLMGLCRIIASVESPGCIRHGGLDPMVALGEPDGSALSENALALADALQAAGVTVQTPPDMHAALWEKLIFIAALSGTGAVARSTIGEVRNCPPTRELLRQSMEETAAVARGRGIRLQDDVVSRTLAFVDASPADGTASMQRDLAAGRPSELEAIVGAVVRFGDQAGVPTPAMDYIYASLLPQEKRARRKGHSFPDNSRTKV
ncbi:MAG TPA: 2-dehydropantoate 2-reductase [Terriglobales bacterium]|nr:2-dehydropantoate 2-reductase [Terriglobales bacterium]